MYRRTPIIVEQHNPSWAEVFSSTKSNLEIILKDIPIIAIEHVGSTSIPNLIAKPVLDIDIEISASEFDTVRDALVAADYRWIGDSGIPGRHAFWQPNSGREGRPLADEMRRNTYVVFTGCLSLRNYRDLKRVLMQDAELRREYGEVKVDLVNDDWVLTVED